MRRIHLVVGLAAGLILSVSGITGSALVFRNEIDALLSGSHRPAADLRSRGSGHSEGAIAVAYDTQAALSCAFH